MNLTHTSKAGLALIVAGILTCLVFTIHLRSIRPNVTEIHGPMRYEATDRNWYPFGLTLCLVGGVLFLAPFFKSKS